MAHSRRQSENTVIENKAKVTVDQLYKLVLQWGDISIRTLEKLQ